MMFYITVLQSEENINSIYSNEWLMEYTSFSF